MIYLLATNIGSSRVASYDSWINGISTADCSNVNPRFEDVGTFPINGGQTRVLQVAIDLYATCGYYTFREGSSIQLTLWNDEWPRCSSR